MWRKFLQPDALPAANPPNGVSKGGTAGHSLTSYPGQILFLVIFPVFFVSSDAGVLL
jgi:hypothetical protein